VRKITIVDIAREAGVSIKTVSRVLNHETGVGEATRARVSEIIKAHGFKPNAAARALPSSRSYMIGMLIRNLVSHYYFSGLQLGMMRSCRRYGYHTMIETTEDFAADREGFIRRLRAAGYDGIVAAPPVCDDPDILAVLEEADIPYVRISPTVALERAPYVFMDDVQASYDVTQHLWGLGHRQIAYLGFADTAANQDRYAGYAQFFREKGLAPPYAQAQVQHTTSATAFEAGEALVTRPDRPTAIFAGTDFLAMGVMAAASKHGLRIPADLSLVGFDDSPGTESVWPPLTTIHQPIADIGEAACDILVSQLGGDRAEKAKTARRLDYSLIVRASTAAPA
jgi:LacI family transcriptional regulator